jgi:hypothetical protein
MIPPDTQPVNVLSCSFKQQQSSNKWQVVTSGQVNGQLSHQEKHGCNLQQQCSQCGNFSWQQSSQSLHVLQPQLLSPHTAHPPLFEHDGVAALQLASFVVAALLQLLLSDETAAAEAEAAGPLGAGGALCCDAL